MAKQRLPGELVVSKQDEVAHSIAKPAKRRAAYLKVIYQICPLVPRHYRIQSKDIKPRGWSRAQLASNKSKLSSSNATCLIRTAQCVPSDNRYQFPTQEGRVSRVRLWQLATCAPFVRRLTRSSWIPNTI